MATCDFFFFSQHMATCAGFFFPEKSPYRISNGFFFFFFSPGDRHSLKIHPGGKKKKQGVCHTVALPFTLKSILMQKKKKN
jgi:hypothetical protein